MLDTLASWHPFIVHFAVAFTIGSAAFDVLDFFFHRKRFEETGFLLMITAMPFLLMAVFTGNLAEHHAPGLEHAAAFIENHMRYANIAIWIFFAAGVWRLFLHLKKQYHGIRKIIYVFIVTAAAMSVYLAALHGSKIRHHHLQAPISILHPAGTPISQAGTPISQAGTPISQAGTPISQAGTPISQAGTPISQAGTPISQAGTPISIE
ncbi:MAG: DUF2231 domain-containing protein [Bacteroidota bacterium]